MTKFTMNKDLQAALEERRLIPFVGAGVSMSVKKADSDEPLFPSWKTLLLSSADTIKQQGVKVTAADLIEALLHHEDEDENSYLKAAQLAKKALGNHAWNTFLKQQLLFSKSQCDESSLELARTIWRLHCPLIITTNYDKVLDWACPEDKIRDLSHWDIESSHEQASSLSGNIPHPTVWHLHGRIDNVNNLILTPDGYSSLYSEEADDEKYKAALATLKTYFTTHRLLFIGFSFDDDIFAGALQAVSHLFDGNTAKHFVLIKESQREKIEQLNLPLIPITYQDYSDLPDFLNSLAQTIAPPVETIVEEAIANTEAMGSLANPSQSRTEKERVSSSNIPDYNPNHPVFNVPFRKKGDGVVGRGEVLLQLRNQLTSGMKTNIGHAASFRGMGGLGKTQLAVEYAYKYQEDYPNGVFWIEADSDIDTQLVQMARATKWFSPHLETADVLIRALDKLKNSTDCLIVFDNVETKEQIQDYLPMIQSTPHLLITSRIDINGFTALPLSLLTPEEAVELLLKEANRNVTLLTEGERTTCMEIVELLGHLPLAIELAGAYLKRLTSVSWLKYNTLLDTNLKTALPEKHLASFTGHQVGLFRTLAITEHEITQSPLIEDILRLLSWSATASMGASLMAALLDVSEEELIEPLALGVELRLFSTTGNDRYSIHRLLKEVQCELHPLAPMAEWGQSVCQRMIIWFEERKDEFLELKHYQAEIDHLKRWQTQAEELCLAQGVSLIWLQSYPLWYLGHYQQSEVVLLKSLVLFDDLLLENDSSNLIIKAHLLSDLGVIKECLGQSEEALGNAEEALKLRLELFGENHADVATSYSNVGSAYGGLGQHNKALEYKQKALDLRLDLFGESHVDVTGSYHNIGCSYYDLRQYDQALKYQQTSLELRIKLLGESHPDVASSYNNVGITCGDLGQYEKALKYLKKAIKLQFEFFDENHPDVTTSYNNIADIYMQLECYDESLWYDRKAFNSRLSCFSTDPRPVINSMRGVVNTLISQKKFAFALKELELLKPLAASNKAIKIAVQELQRHIKKSGAKSGFRVNSPTKKATKRKPKIKRR